MVMIPQCDKCGVVYEGGFNGSRQTVISSGPKMKKKDFTIVITISPAQLCEKCFRLLVRECLKGGV